MSIYSKRMVCVAIVVACSLALFYGTALAAEKVTLQFWTMNWIDGDSPPSVIPKAVEDFNKAHPDIQVELTMLEWKTGRQKIQQAVASGTGPDVFINDFPISKDYLEARVLMSIDKLGYSSADIRGYSGIVDSLKYENKYYGVPIYLDVMVLFHRTDWLKNAGFTSAPDTWDDLEEAAKKLTRDVDGDGKTDVYGIAIKGMDEHLNAIGGSFLTFFFQAGGEEMDITNTRTNYYSRAGIKALTFLRGLYEKGYAGVGVSAANGFQSGKVAMYNFLQGDMNNIKLNAPQLAGKWSIAPMPEGPVSGTSSAGGQVLVANAATKYPKEVATFVKWFTSPEASLRWFERGKLYPYVIDKLQDSGVRSKAKAILSGNPLWEGVLEQVKRLRPVERYIGSALVRQDAMNSLIPAAISGTMAIDKALKELDRICTQSLTQ